MVMNNTPMKNVRPTTNPLNINLPDGTIVKSTHICDLEIPGFDIGPLINLGTQHDGRSARTWMKRDLTTFVSLWEGEKDLLESTKMDFYET